MSRILERPSKRVDTYTEDGATVIEVRASGAYDYAAYQTDSQFTLSVEELTEQEAERRQEERFPYSGENCRSTSRISRSAPCCS